MTEKLFDITEQTIQDINNNNNKLDKLSIDDPSQQIIIRLNEEMQKKTFNEQKLNSQINCLNTQIQFYQKSFEKLNQEKDQLKQEMLNKQQKFKKELQIRDEVIVTLKKAQEEQKSIIRKIEHKSRTQQLSLANQKLKRSTTHFTANQPHHIDENENSAIQDPALQKPITGNFTNPTNIQSEDQQQFNQELNNQIQQQKVVLSNQQFDQLKKTLIRTISQEENQAKMNKQLQKLQINQIISRDQQKYFYEINQLKQQLHQKENDKEKHKHLSEMLHDQVRRLNQKQIEQTQKDWSQEVNSQSNQNYVLYYKDKLYDKNKEILNMKKSIKKYNILERQLLVKEKAFEFERSDYHEKIISLSDRVNRLQILYKDVDAKLNKSNLKLINPSYVKHSNLDGNDLD